MKIFLIVFLVFTAGSCSHMNHSERWDSGASKQNTYQEQQAQEQTEYTNNQFQTPGASGVEQNQPF